MKGKVLTQNAIDDFAAYLKNEEKSENTIQKYIHDIQDFMRFANYLEITKGMVIEYKNKLISENYAIRSINSMLAALNSLFTFLEWEDFKVIELNSIYIPIGARLKYTLLFFVCQWIFIGNE